MGWTKLLDEHDNEVGIVGDDGWDLAGNFVDAFQQLYLKKFGRTATLLEVMTSIEFVYATSLELATKNMDT